jgi:uncharacterized membrane protein YeaQ/YmgE (transglycosylase-associated protein family)
MREEEMNLTVTLTIGAVVGWLASIVRKDHARMTLLANVIVGVAGAYLGLLIAHAMGVGTYAEAGAWVAPVVGASLSIVVMHAVGTLQMPGGRLAAPPPAAASGSFRLQSARAVDAGSAARSSVGSALAQEAGQRKD